MKRWFGVLLRAYPKRFRETYEDDLHAFFAEERRDPRYQSALGKVRLSLGVMVDVMRNAVRLRYQSRSKRRARNLPREVVMGRDLRASRDQGTSLDLLRTWRPATRA